MYNCEQQEQICDRNVSSGRTIWEKSRMQMSERTAMLLHTYTSFIVTT